MISQLRVLPGTLRRKRVTRIWYRESQMDFKPSSRSKTGTRIRIFIDDKRWHLIITK